MLTAGAGAPPARRARRPAGRAGRAAGAGARGRPPAAAGSSAVARSAPRPQAGGWGAARGAKTAARAAKKKFGSFDEMLSGATTPVLVDFYATWCGPCVMLSSELQKVGKALGEERIQIVKIDTEKYPKIASKFNVEALPTVLLFKGGEVVDRIEGMLDANQLQTRLNYFLSSP